MLLSIVAIPVFGQSLIINELMQSNVDVYMDQETREFPDSWVELYNNSSLPVSLSEYKIGTKKDKNNKPIQAWQLPKNVVIPAHDYLLVYCDKKGEDLQGELLKMKANGNATYDDVERARLHTNFRLESGKGCVVYLFKNNVLDQLASVVDSMKKQPAPNISYGRMSDGGRGWGYELKPSPGWANGGGICEHNHILGEPLFSVSGYVNTDSEPILLTLSLPRGCPKSTKIYYTMSGKEPTENDLLYTGPFTISQTTVIRAKLFCEGWLSPMSTTHSYIFLGRELTLPVISLSTNESYLVDSIIGIFSHNTGDNRQNYKNWRRPINIEYFEGERTKSIMNQLCETRVGGCSTRENLKKTLIIYAHKRFGKKLFDHEFFPDQKPGLHKFKSLSLRNAGNDFNFLYMRDALAQRSMGMYVDLDWQAWRPAIVYINGKYYGMLNIRERAEEDNIYTNYDGMDDIDMFENWDNIKEGDWDHLNRFTAFYKEDNHSLAEYEQWMDCREFINLMIMNLFYNNIDFPGNNIVMWRPRTEGGRWRWIAKDADETMGFFAIPCSYETFEWFHDPDFDQNWHWNANGYPYTLLFRQLMKNQDFRNEFVDRCHIYIGDFLNYESIHKLLETMYQEISREMSFYGPLISLRPDDHHRELEYVDSWIECRTDKFMQQLFEFYQLEATASLSINSTSTENQLAKLTFNDHQLSKPQFNGRFCKNHQIRLTAQTKKGVELVGWRIQRAKGGKTFVEEQLGADLTVLVPDCSQLTIEPLYK